MHRVLLVTFLLVFPLFADAAKGVSYLEIAGGRAITVLNSATANQEIESATDDGREILKYDPMTGILISQNTDSKAYSKNTVKVLNPMDSLFNEQGEKVAIVVGTERRNDGKILPFGYHRIQYLSEPLTSGTFLFDDKKYLVAILYNSDKKYKDQGYATPIKAVLRGAEDYLKNGDLTTGRIGVITSTSGSIPEVLSVRPDQPAKKAGIMKGDFLLKVGEKDISNYLEMREAFYYLIPGKAEKFSVIRDGTMRVLTLTPVK